MTAPDTTPWTPRRGNWIAWAVFLLAALSIFHPMLTGQFLAGDDQVIAGYGFREFGASFFKTYGHIPQWNPFLFGGLPFFGVIGHGDIFYPTAWLRWVVPTGFGMTLGFFVHVVLAGGTMYGLLRTLRLAWIPAVVGGLAYEMSGIVLSQISPGHDGKLFVSALAPLALMALVRAIRHQRIAWHGILAITIGLAILSPQVQMAYYLLVACGLWTLWLVFLDPERDRTRPSITPLALAALAVVLGLGIASIQLLPIFSHIPFTPRAEGGDSVGWAYATSYSFHLKEFLTVILPQFNGVLEHYWGQNAIKSHTEYLGAIVVVLAIVGIGGARRRGLFAGLGAIALLFLLVSLAADTPFYKLWYELMPNMKNVRAAGMAFYLVALPVCVWAACGVESLLKGELTRNKLIWPLGVIGGIALLGVIGVLQGVAETLAAPEARQVVLANADALRMGSMRLLVIVLVGAGVLLATQRGRLRGAAAAGALFALVFADQWSVLQQFAKWLPPTNVTYADDEIIRTMQQTALPFRVLDPAGAVGQAGLYQGSILMAHAVPAVFGYHGMESRFYDDLFGGKGAWVHQLSPSLQALWAVKYVTLNQPVDSLPGYHQIKGPVSFPNLMGRRAAAGFLWERDAPAEWVRVVPGAVTVADSLIASTVADPGYPIDRVALYPDTAVIAGASSTPTVPAEPSPITATLAHWEPGAMSIDLTGVASAPAYLLVAENWYPDWKVTIDGVAGVPERANGAMLSVVLPPGAKHVELRFAMDSYRTGQWLMLLSLVGAVVLIGIGVAGRARRADG
ncbi:MAG TPA: hypothetical protein VFN22_08410 [Gemmatimonadales bacterium]|nr:hypothetical protein [Gemmatimonadales bacterium]